MPASCALRCATFTLAKCTHFCQLFIGRYCIAFKCLVDGQCRIGYVVREMLDEVHEARLNLVYQICMDKVHY